jgi:hypothetical protein
MTRDDREDFAKTRERFLRETRGHEMTISLDLSQDKENPQLYRHLRFSNKSQGGYWFDILTWPGGLTFRGDGESYSFSVYEPDTLKLFRNREWRGKYMDVRYCAEKLTSNRDCVIEYQEELFVKAVKEQAEYAIENDQIEKDQLERFWETLKNEIFEAGEISAQEGAIEILNSFEFYNDESKEFSSSHKADFDFQEWWEWFDGSVKGYNWWFMWAICALCWGVEQYDAVVGTKAQNTARQGRDTAEVGQKATVGSNATWGRNTAREGVKLG